MTDAPHGTRDAGRPAGRHERTRRVLDRPAVVGAGVALVLAAAGQANRWVLLLAVVALQLVLTHGWLRLLSVAAPRGSAVVGLGAAAVADVLLVTGPTDPTLRELAAVLALALFAALVQQLARADRTGLTAALAATLSLAGIAVAASMLLAVPQTRGLIATVLVGLAAARVAALAADTLAAFPAVSAGRRDTVGIVVGTAVAAVVGWQFVDEPASPPAVRALLVAAPALVMLATEAVVQRSSTGERRRRSVAEVLATLPLAVAAPAAYLAARVLLT